MAQYATRIDQMQGYEHCTGYNADREHPRSTHCQHKRDRDDRRAKAITDLAAHHTADKLNDSDGQDQRCNTIDLGDMTRQHGDQDEKNAKYGADDTEANTPEPGGSVCGRS
jgi:hypothetical protein